MFCSGLATRHFLHSSLNLAGKWRQTDHRPFLGRRLSLLLHHPLAVGQRHTPQMGREPTCTVDQSRPTLCNPMEYSTPGSSVHRIVQTRILQWVAIPFPRGSSRPRDQAQVYCISCIGRRILHHWEATWEAPTLASKSDGWVAGSSFC